MAQDHRRDDVRAFRAFEDRYGDVLPSVARRSHTALGGWRGVDGRGHRSGAPSVGERLVQAEALPVIRGTEGARGGRRLGRLAGDRAL